MFLWIRRKQQRRALVSKTSCSIFKTNLYKMKTLATALAIVLSFSLASVAKPKPKLAILVFSKTKGYRHASIPIGKMAIMKLGQENNMTVDTTEDASFITTENLKKYKAVVFLSTTGDIFDEQQQAAFEKYIRAGNGFVGIHAAADTEYKWPWYNQLVGAYFLSHPKQQDAVIEVHSQNMPFSKSLPDRWKRYDEWYNYKNIVMGLKVVATLDESTYSGGANGLNHPIIWFREFDGGRSFYTGLGHTDASFSEPLFLQHLLGGIQYAVGKK